MEEHEVFPVLLSIPNVQEKHEPHKYEISNEFVHMFMNDIEIK